MPIARQFYSWEKDTERKSTPFFLRWWFWGPLGLLVVAVAGMLLGIAVLRRMYEAKAEKFDLGTIGQMEAATSIYDRKGEFLGKIFIQNRNPIPYSEMPPMLVKAVVAEEDNRFYEHHGVDYFGIMRAAIANYKSGKKKEGASTVTQQLARNSFGLRERTYDRKLIEIFLSMRIEKQLSKERIMELYLNRVYFGSGLWGVEAAARGYFGVPAKDMSIGQCATLAGLLKSPNGLSPWNNRDGAENARNIVLQRMKEMKFISNEEYRREKENILVVRKRANPYKVSYAIDYIRQQAIAALGYERAMNGGFKITSTVDLKMQRATEASLRRKLSEIEAQPGYQHPTYQKFAEEFKPVDDVLRNGGFPQGALPTPQYVQGAVVAFDNATGGILTMVGGREFKHSEYNRATQARRPAGTAFTPFVFAAAYEKGIFPGQIVEDAALDNRYVNVGGTTGILGEWGVESKDNEYEGGIPSREALAKSKNSATVRLGWQTGLDPVLQLAAKAGIRSPLRKFSNTFIGSSEVTLDELTLAYTMFPAGGKRPAHSFIIAKITNDQGEIVYQSRPELVPVVSDATAFEVHAGLQDALFKGTGAAMARQCGLENLLVAGKTGTAYNFTDTYFIGYTNAVTCGVWIGFDKPTKIYRGAFGKDLALPVWADAIKSSISDFPPKALQKPGGIKAVSICRASGLLACPRCVVQAPASSKPDEKISLAYTEYGTEKQTPSIYCDVHGAGLRSYMRDYAEADWPRAAAAVDLASIRPVAVSAPALIGLSDAYHSVRPAAFRIRGEDIPVAKALPVKDETAESAEEPPTGTAAPSDAPADNQEVRKAEIVKPLDSQMDSAISVPTPEPIKF